MAVTPDTITSARITFLVPCWLNPGLHHFPTFAVAFDWLPDCVKLPQAKATSCGEAKSTGVKEGNVQRRAVALFTTEVSSREQALPPSLPNSCVPLLQAQRPSLWVWVQMATVLP